MEWGRRPIIKDFRTIKSPEDPAISQQETADLKHNQTRQALLCRHCAVISSLVIRVHLCIMGTNRVLCPLFGALCPVSPASWSLGPFLSGAACLNENMTGPFFFFFFLPPPPPPPPPAPPFKLADWGVLYAVTRKHVIFPRGGEQPMRRAVMFVPRHCDSDCAWRVLLATIGT